VTYFHELDTYLSQNYSVDNWEDSACLYAIELMRKLNPDDWDTLESAWLDRTPQWQHYCADVIAWGDPDRAIPVLIEMIQFTDDELTIIAADALREVRHNLTSTQVTPSVRDRLRAVARNHPGITDQVIKDLLE
jgi:hypothetical protein